MDSERGAEGFQGSFSSLFCCHHLMVLTTADPICTALISQPAFYPLSQFYIGSHVCNPLPLPFSARLSTTYSIRYLPAPSVLYMPLLLDATSILEREEVVELPYGDDTLNSGPRDQRGVEGWNAEGYDAGRKVRMV